MHLIGSFLLHLACSSYLFDNGMLYNLCDRSVVHCSIALCKTDVSLAIVEQALPGNGMLYNLCDLCIVCCSIAL